MDTIVETMEDAISQESQAETRSGSAQPGDNLLETQLTQEISELWSSHVRLNGDRKATAKELRQIRASLAERLHEMKLLLSRPGRSGQWRSWLRERGIPRSTADRLVSRHAETVGIENGNVPSEAIDQEHDAVEQLVQSLLPRLQRRLPDAQAVFHFIAALAGAFGLGSEISGDGIWVFQPGPPMGEGSSSALDAPEEASAEGAISLGPEVPSSVAVAA